MRIIRDIEQFKSRGTALTIGKFDGVHIGHRKLLETLMDEKGNLESCVFTFDVNKDCSVLDHDHRICSEKEKEGILSELGIETLVLFPFDDTAASMLPDDFVRDILVKKLNIKLLVVGDDFHFGKDRLGDTDLLMKLSKELDFRLIVVDREEFEGFPVSSSRIREELQKKNYTKAGAMLGRE